MTGQSGPIICQSLSPKHKPADGRPGNTGREYCKETGKHSEHRCCCGFTWTTFDELAAAR